MPRFRKGFLVVLSMALSSLSVLAHALDDSNGLPRLLERNLTSVVPASIIYQCKVSGTVAMTFDDGPYLWTQKVADILTNAGAKGTFFMNGNNKACIYDEDVAKQVKYVFDQGHQIASHTWTHQDLTSMDWDQIHRQMWLTEQAIQRITGAYPAYMRPPYGKYNNAVLEAAAVRGQKVVLLDINSGDVAGLDVGCQKLIFEDLAARRPSTALTLQHEIFESTVYDVLPYAIQKLQQAGYRLVTVAECLGKSPYQYVGAPGIRTEQWTC